MKTNEKNNVLENSSITVFRYKMDDLEKKLVQEHEIIKNDIAITLAKDLAGMKPSKPEAECFKDVYSGVINGAYSRMMSTVKKEIKSEIETHHLVADKLEADKKLQEAETELEKVETAYRLKKRELESCDKTIGKKAGRYKWTRLILIFLVLVDTLISGTALQAMGYPLITSYIIGLAIGIGIFYIAENLPEIIEKGKTPLQKRLLAAAIFSVLFIVFYVLGIFRTTTFKGGDVFDGGSGPLYFACLNLFFTAVAMIVVYFTGLSRDEKKILDKYKTAEDEAKELKKELDALKLEITKVRKEQKDSELARKQIQIYAHDMQEMVQSLYEESQKTFFSTNCIHRSDGKVPKFFEEDIPMLSSFHKNLTI